MLSYEYGYSHVAIQGTGQTGYVATEDLAPAPPSRSRVPRHPQAPVTGLPPLYSPPSAGRGNPISAARRCPSPSCQPTLRAFRY